MEFHSKPLPESRVRGWNGPLPFYMSYPGFQSPGGEQGMLQDLEYLQQMYPNDVKRYQKRIADILDKADYEGSMIYDEYPDKWQIYRLSRDISDRIKREEEKEQKEVESPPEKWEWLGDLVQILLCYEIYKRRHDMKRGILRF